MEWNWQYFYWKETIIVKYVNPLNELVTKMNITRKSFLRAKLQSKNIKCTENQSCQRIVASKKYTPMESH